MPIHIYRRFGGFGPSMGRQSVLAVPDSGVSVVSGNVGRRISDEITDALLDGEESSLVFFKIPLKDGFSDQGVSLLFHSCCLTS